MKKAALGGFFRKTLLVRVFFMAGKQSFELVVRFWSCNSLNVGDKLLR